MLSRNKTYHLIAIIASIITFSSTTNANAVYGGEDATGEILVSTTYMNSGCSVAPIAPRILIMAQHCPAIPNQTKYVYPGESYKSTNTVTALKTFVPSGEFKGGREYDIMAVVVDKDMPFNQNVKIATEKEIDRLKYGNNEITIYGFGITESGMRSENAKRGSFVMYSGKDLGNGISDNYNLYLSVMPKNGIQEICNGDSGSPAYFLIDNDIYYIGTVFSANKIYGCGTQKEIMPIARIQTIYPFIDIVNQAENWILQNKPKSDILIPDKVVSNVVVPKKVDGATTTSDIQPIKKNTIKKKTTKKKK